MPDNGLRSSKATGNLLGQNILSCVLWDPDTASRPVVSLVLSVPFVLSQRKKQKKMQIPCPAGNTVCFTSSHFPFVYQEMHLSVRREVCLTESCHPWGGDPPVIGSMEGSPTTYTLPLSIPFNQPSAIWTKACYPETAPSIRVWVLVEVT